MKLYEVEVTLNGEAQWVPVWAETLEEADTVATDQYGRTGRVREKRQ